MNFKKYYVEGSNGKSNCVIRTFCKLYNKEYDIVFEELCSLAKELDCESFNDVEVFETYMERNKTTKIDYGKDIKVKDLELDNGNYIVFCYDKKDDYHMVVIMDNVIYDKDDKKIDFYTIQIYKDSR